MKRNTLLHTNMFVYAVIVIGITIIIVLLVLTILTYILKKYNLQIVTRSISQKLEYQNLLSEATAGLYENIFEIDITNNRTVGESTKEYLQNLGLDWNAPYDEGLRAIAKFQIKEEYVQTYLDTFLPAHVIQSYKSGITNLSYDFMISHKGGGYQWMRIIGRIFYWDTDRSVRMISYRKNIDEEKKRELLLMEKSQQDSLTGLLNKETTESAVTEYVRQKAGRSCKCAFIIFDLDNFKNINDRYGHVFGDFVITEFAEELKNQFQKSDFVGRIGGDEFAVLTADYSDTTALSKKLEQFCTSISQKDFGRKKDGAVSCSIGAALYLEQGSTYPELYEKADQALYYAKAHGKNTFHILGTEIEDSMAFHVDFRDMKELLDNATDGVAKFACTQQLTLLYFNQKLLELTGASALSLSEPDFDCYKAVCPEDLNIVRKQIEASASEKKQIVLSFRICRRDGQYIKVKVCGLFIQELYQNKYPVFYAVFTDLTDF